MALKNDLGFDDLESRLRLLLPEEYQDCYKDIEPVSMGSAGLKFDVAGKVAWDEVWGSFCDLAMAGGPPHRGTLLEPGTAEEIEAHRDRYQEVVLETCRGISMVTGLIAEESHRPGWVRVYCRTDAMAGWLTRAIVTENVSARFDGHVLSLPVGHSYRIEREIKNVITSLAKTCHYWREHTSAGQQQAIANLLIRMELESSLIQPFLSEQAAGNRCRTLAAMIAQAASRFVGLSPSNHQYTGWLGLDLLETAVAIRTMRFLVAGNVLSRREGTALFVPLNPESDPAGERVIEALREAWRHKQ